MIERFSILMFLLLLILGGCEQHRGSEMYGVGGRAFHNISTQDAMHHEILLNIVRVRYSEPPFFIGNVHVTYRPRTQNTLVSFFKKMFVKDAADRRYFENAPEASYAPVKGEPFLNRFMEPIDLELIEKLVSHGWEVERTFRLFVKKLGKTVNLESYSGPIPIKPPEYQGFLKLANLLQNAYVEQQLDIKVVSSSGVRDETEADGESSSSQSPGKAMQISLPPNTKESDELADFLNISKKRRTWYQFDLLHQVPSGILTRSLLEVIHYLSLGVQIPPSHSSSEALTVTLDEEGNPFDWNDVIGDLITIHWSNEFPENAFVSVYYHGHWFYIDNHDVNSKKTFSLFQHAYMYQVE